MSQNSTRTRELCQSYLGILETAEINPMVINTFRRLIRSHQSMAATAVGLAAELRTLTAKLAAKDTDYKALLSEIEAMHEASAGAAL